MILVTGGNGQLAQCLKQKLPEAIYASREECDITDFSQTESFIDSHKPEIVINCAAYTNVDKAEEEPQRANEINIKGSANLAKLSKKQGFALIHVSTDYVFDGEKNTPYSENDTCSPKSIYGKSKLAGEELIRAITGKHIIIRTSWLYSEFGSNFVKNITKLLRSREVLGIVFDQVGSPTYAQDLAGAIAQIANSPLEKKFGTYHYSNLGVSSWYDLTKEIQILLDLKTDVLPIQSHEYPTPAKRPHYSVFNTKKIREVFNINIPHWKESLEKCLKKL